MGSEPSDLTDRELAVLRLLMTGLTIPEIAEALGISRPWCGYGSTGCATGPTAAIAWR